MPKGLLIDDDDELGHATFGPRRRSRASDQVEQREWGEMTLCAVVVRTGIWKWAMELGLDLLAQPGHEPGAALGIELAGQPAHAGVGVDPRTNRACSSLALEQR